MIEDRWTANESFIFEDSGVFSILTQYNRIYTKINKGKTITAVIHTSDNWTLPCLMSTNSEYVKSSCKCYYDNNTIISDSNNINFGTSIKYLGLTWYFAVAPWGVEYITNPDGFASTISVDASYSPGFTTPQDSEMKKLALGLLKASNVRLLYSKSFKNSIKDKILNNKLFQEHCVPYMED